jgi:hypothetical protein
MTERAYGTKYDKNLNTTQIAAMVRGEVKAAVKAGELPAGKYSIRSSYYSGGSSIRVSISGLSGNVFDPEYLERGDAYLMGPSVHDETGWHRPHRYQAWVLAAVKKVEAMLWAYNHDGSDSQTDHFDVKFYGSVDVDTSREDEQAVRAALATAKDYAGEAAMSKSEESAAAPLLSNVVPLFPAVKPVEESAQVRLMRELGAL